MLELAPGKGELLVRLLAAHPDARATGIDRSPWFLRDAQARAAELGVADRLELRDEDATQVSWPVDALDLAIAVGAAGIIGDHAATVAALARMVRPGGGLVLFGDGVWIGEPPAEWLAAFGMERGELPNGLDGQQALGAAAGLEPLWSELVTVEEWDDYESGYGSLVERWATAHPEDPDRDAFMARTTLMRQSYAEWRRDSFGFGITLFRRP
jgi:SAM-dependent methyltransferase